MPQINFSCTDKEANLYAYLGKNDGRKRSSYIAKKMREMHANYLAKIADGSLVLPLAVPDMMPTKLVAVASPAAVFVPKPAVKSLRK